MTSITSLIRPNEYEMGHIDDAFKKYTGPKLAADLALIGGNSIEYAALILIHYLSAQTTYKQLASEVYSSGHELECGWQDFFSRWYLNQREDGVWCAACDIDGNHDGAAFITMLHDVFNQHKEEVL